MITFNTYSSILVLTLDDSRMPDNEDSGQVDLGFLYKMLDTRDSSKRRVKPADPAFLFIPKVRLFG